MTPAVRIKKLSDALGKCLDAQRSLKADVAELEAVAGALEIALNRGGGNQAALEAWEIYKERKHRNDTQA
jgi:hypothetical protein